MAAALNRAVDVFERHGRLALAIMATLSMLFPLAVVALAAYLTYAPPDVGEPRVCWFTSVSGPALALGQPDDVKALRKQAAFNLANGAQPQTLRLEAQPELATWATLTRDGGRQCKHE